MAKKDKKLSKKFYPYVETPGDLPLYVLAINGRGRKFDLLGVVDSWGAEFKETRDKTLFSVSTNRTDFGPEGNETFFEIITRSTHVAKNGELYATRDGDTVQAFLFDWAYKVYGHYQGKFDLKDTEPEVI